MKEYCVYEHVFPNGKKYIGISCDAEKRWRNGKGYEKQGKIANAIKHFGWDNVQHNIILNAVSKEQAKALEKYLIAELETIDNGYNTTIGGDNILSSYLNDHVLYMIRESKRFDEKYGEKQKPDDIVSIAESAKYDKKKAEIINNIDKLIQTKHCEYKQYKRTSLFHDFAETRIDCYWWTMKELLSNGTVPYSKDNRPYWDYWRTHLMKGCD